MLPNIGARRFGIPQRPVQQFPQPVQAPVAQAPSPDPWRRMLGSFDKIKKPTTVKRSGAYKLKAGEKVVPKHAKKTSLASLK